MAVKKPTDLSTIKELVQFMREAGVHSFETADVKVEFAMNASSSRAPIPVTVDDEAERMKELRELLAEAQKDEAANLAWST
jgi:hypothetical protein